MKQPIFLVVFPTIGRKTNQLLSIAALLAVALAASNCAEDNPAGPGVGSEAGWSGYVFAGTWGAGVFRSAGNGESWEPAHDGLANSSITALVTDSSGHLFAGTYEAGIFRSADNGDTWTPINNGLKNPLDPSTYQSSTPDTAVLFLDSNAHGISFAGISFAGIECRIFRSADSGESWTSISRDFPRDEEGDSPRLLAFAIDARGHLFAGTSMGYFRSVDNRDSWTRTSSRYSADFLVAHEHGQLFAGTEFDGILHSADGGASWTPINKGLPRDEDGEVPGVFSLEIDSSGQLFAGTGEGISRSTDHGTTWKSVGNGLRSTPVGVFVSDHDLPANAVFALASPARGQLFAGTSRGVFHSVDHGESWMPINDGLPDRTAIFCFAFNAD